MKVFFQAGSLAVAASVLAGCFSNPKSYYHAGDETPPAFLSGPVSILLTNADGYSARLTGSMAQPGGGQRTVSGDILERQGSLVFQPFNAVKGKRARSEGGMFFIWNESDHSGYVLSDPLQAFAAASTSVRPTNVVLNVSGATQETVNGHPCRKIEAVVQSSDGSSNRFALWQAEDARRFPVRIQSPGGLGGMTLNFSDVRLELPAQQLFTPPDGFVKYDSPAALMNELIIRQTAMTKEGERLPVSSSDGPGGPVNNWRAAPPQ